MGRTSKETRASRESIEREFSQIIAEVSKLAKQSESEPDRKKPGDLVSLEAVNGLSTGIERFSHLVSELTELLTSLLQNARNAIEQLDVTQSAVELKKKELQELHKIDAAAATLEQLMEEQRSRKEEFEGYMGNQRRLWEEEKARRTQEEEEHFQNLKDQRHREEEEYERMWAAERMKAQQMLEEEIRTLQRQNEEKQRALERDWRERELALKGKETEWIRLIQELEQFLFNLSGRTQTQIAAQTGRAEKATRSPISSPAPNADVLLRYNRNKVPSQPISRESEPLPKEAVHAASEENVSQSAPRLEVVPEQKSAAADRKSALADVLDPIFGNDKLEDKLEEPKPSLSSLKEMFVSQGRKIESLNEELFAKRESTHSRFFSRWKLPKPKNEKLQ